MDQGTGQTEKVVIINLLNELNAATELFAEMKTQFFLATVFR